MDAQGPITRTRVVGKRTITVTATWKPSCGLWSINRKVDDKLVEAMATPIDPALHVQRLLDMKIE